MPKVPKRQIARPKKKVSKELMRFLEEGGTCPDFEFWFESGYLERQWKVVRTEVLERWRRERPGRRPSMWWNLDSPPPEEFKRGSKYEPIKLQRRMLKRGKGWPRGSGEFGLPDHCDPPGDDPMAIPSGLFEFESEAAYLDRFGLLDEEEKSRLTDTDFEPVTLEATSLSGWSEPGTVLSEDEEWEKFVTDNPGWYNPHDAGVQIVREERRTNARRKDSKVH